MKTVSQLLTPSTSPAAYAEASDRKRNARWTKSNEVGSAKAITPMYSSWIQPNVCALNIHATAASIEPRNRARSPPAAGNTSRSRRGRRGAE